MTPEDWARVRTYEPHGSFDNPGYGNDEAGPHPTPWQLARAARWRTRGYWLMAGVAFVLLVLFVTSSKP
jgi:hypothetical protein